jgi:hypothetical protein
MAALNGKPIGRPAYRDRSVNAPLEPGDEVNGYWTRERLEEMDRRFVSAVERAFATGYERRPGEQKLCSR